MVKTHKPCKSCQKYFCNKKLNKLSNTSVRDFDLCLESCTLPHKWSCSYSHSQCSQNAAVLHKTGKEVTTKKACRSHYKGTDCCFLRKQISLQGVFLHYLPPLNWEVGIDHANAVASCTRHLPQLPGCHGVFYQRS